MSRRASRCSPPARHRRERIIKSKRTRCNTLEPRIHKKFELCLDLHTISRQSTARGSRRVERLAETSFERDETARISPFGFGQHENPICERPRRLAAAITSSNFESMRFFLTAPGLHRSRSEPFRTSELLAARTPSLPSACSHHTVRVARSAIGRRLERPLLHKNFQFSTAFRSNPRYPQRRGRPEDPDGLVHENRSARVLADSSSAKTASNSHRRLVASVPVSFSRAHPPSSPPAWTDDNAAGAGAQGGRADRYRALTRRGTRRPRRGASRARRRFRRGRSGRAP